MQKKINMSIEVSLATKDRHHFVELRMKYIFVTILLLFASVSSAQFRSDSLPPPITQTVQPDINWGRVGITTAVFAATVTSLHILQYKAW